MAKQFQFRGVGEKKDRESLNLPIVTKMWVSLISDLTMARWQRRLELLCWNEKDASGIVHAILGLGIENLQKHLEVSCVGLATGMLWSKDIGELSNSEKKRALNSFILALSWRQET